MDANFTVQDVILNAVEDAPSYLYGSAIACLLRYRVGQGAQPLEACKGYLEFLIKIEVANEVKSHADS